MKPGLLTLLCNAAHTQWGRNGLPTATASRAQSLEEMRRVLKEAEFKTRCVKGPVEAQITDCARGKQGAGSASSAELGRGHTGAGLGGFWGG